MVLRSVGTTTALVMAVRFSERNENEVIVQVILLKSLLSIVGLKNSCVDSILTS